MQYYLLLVSHSKFNHNTTKPKTRILFILPQPSFFTIKQRNSKPRSTTMNNTIYNNKIEESDIFDTINGMIKQENSAYRTKNGLYDDQEEAAVIDGECRRLMIVWFKQLAQFVNINHHTIAVTINVLDRYISKDPSIISNNDDYAASHDFQLAAITSLYTTVKAHELLAIDPTTMSKLSKGAISSQEIEEMEFKILKKLQWRMNAPTAMEFAELYLKVLFLSSEEEEISIQRKLIQCQIECAMEDTRFLGMSASDIAFTATYNASLAIPTTSSIDHLTTLQIAMNNVDFLPRNLRDILMDHMQLSESDTISSCSSSYTATKHQQSSGSRWIPSAKAMCNYLSPRSITIPRAA